MLLERLLLTVMLLLLVLAPAGGCLWYLGRVYVLDSDGATAHGVVIGGETGSTMDGALYCVETIQFQDARGDPRFTKRSCPGGEPANGEKVTVHYDPADPDKSYVDGDHNFASVIAMILFGTLFVQWIRRPLPEPPTA